MLERRILVGVDGRSQGHDAVALAVAIAEVTGASLMLAHVYEPPGKWSGTRPEAQRSLREHNERAIQTALLHVPGHLHAEHAVVGSILPAPALCGLAQEQACDGIVVGSTHRHLAGRLVIGSTGELLLSGAHLPVAVAPPGFATRPLHRFLRVVSAYDGSPEAEAALAAAARFASVADAHLRVISVTEPRPFHHGPDPDDRRRWREHLGRSLVQLHAQAEIDMQQGDPAEKLLEACGVADLMFAGARGHGPIRDELPGPVSAKLIRSCDCPVVVLPRALAAALPEASAAAEAS